ncbi:MAG: AMP-binding protein [Deltaproteobacteria bacterium]|nr:AMP-binding protein [Deltaproteobacteria bacterium]
MEAHLATLWESFADAVGDRPALVCGERRRTWREFDDRASRLAAAFAAVGLKTDSKVGQYLYNSNEYLESQFAAFKLRAVPVNINYRYLDDELLYLLENSDSEALLFHSSLAERVAHVMNRAPKIKLWVEVDADGDAIPGAVTYESLIASHEPAPRIRRSESDVYMIYTGGTTGMPKGVMYEISGLLELCVHIGFVFSGLGAAPALADVSDCGEELWRNSGSAVSIPACPLMHGTGMWLGAMTTLSVGGSVAMLEERSFDAHELWRVAEREKADQIVIVGDSFSKPMLRALEEAREAGRPYDLSCLKTLVSSGAMWTSEVKKQFLDWHEMILYDVLGSSEGGIGAQITTRGNIGETASFSMNPTTKVFTEYDREVLPGSGESGMVAVSGVVPIGYYKDEVKSRATFKTIDGVRYSFPGDWGLIEADGTLTLLGRGSGCINTAGEKVYPEEVEVIVKQHPDVIDCLVVAATSSTNASHPTKSQSRSYSPTRSNAPPTANPTTPGPKKPSKKP